MIEEVTKNPVVAVENVYFSYGANRVLEEINLRVGPRDFVGLIGPNGGGKTTLLKLILGLLPMQEGSVRLFGLPPVRGRRFAGYVPQHINLDRDFPISVMDVVLMGRLRHAPRVGPYRAEDRAAAEEALEQLGVIDLRKRTIGELSGGQIQRVLIARAIAGQPQLLALDEPTANVDSRFQHEIPEILRRLNERMTILMISHDLGFVSSYVNWVLCLNRRMVSHPTEQITSKVIEELYHSPMHIVRHEHKI
jgi:zinc transport system ATP-binding protein